jgi:hypothetical protein
VDQLDPRDLPPVPAPQARRNRARRERHFDKARAARAMRNARRGEAL